MQKFTQQLPKDDLKKFAKEVGKKLVASDFKNNRVEDPTKISEKQEKKVKKYVREYFEKAVEKKRAMDKRKKEKVAAASASDSKDTGINGHGVEKVEGVNGVKDDLEPEAELIKEGSDVEMSDDEDKDDPVPETPSLTESSDLKRKRDEDELGTLGDDADSNKRLKEEDGDTVDVSPPPPPPPPPAEGMPDMGMDDSRDDMHVEQVKEETEEEKELRQQEEDLMRENEEAMMMEMDGSLKAEEKLHNHNGVDELHSNGLPERKGVLSH